MTNTSELIRKLDTLNEQDFRMVVNLIDRLSVSTTEQRTDDVTLFREIRKRTSRNPMTEEEVAAEVDAARRELYAANSN